MNSIAVMGGRRVMPRPRGIHSSGLSFAVGGKLMKFALSAQARGGGKREREKSGRREARAVACRRALVIYVPSLHHLRGAWKLLLHRPNISLLMFHRDTLFQGGKGVATSICQNILKAIDPGTRS